MSKSAAKGMIAFYCAAKVDQDKLLMGLCEDIHILLRIDLTNLCDITGRL